LSTLFLRILKEPLFHFTLIGAAIYGLYAFSDVEAESTNPRDLRISAEEVQWLAASRWNRQPTQDELDRVLKSYIEERVLASEAAAMGLDKDDAVIRRRLAQRLKFLSEDLMTPTDPDPEAIRQYFEKHLDRYREPVRYTFSQIYFDPDKRGAQALKEAEAVRDALNDAADHPPELTSYGDPFMLQNFYPELTRTDLARTFGSDFAEAVVGLDPGRWYAPILSGYGVHAVLISAITTPDEPVFADVAMAVRQDWTEATRRKLSREFLDNLVSGYDITVEETDVALLNPDAQASAATAPGIAVNSDPESQP